MLTVSTSGSKFHGFQIQNKLRTVQGDTKSFKNICKEEIIIHGSGRTKDTEIHGG